MTPRRRTAVKRIVIGIVALAAISLVGLYVFADAIVGPAPAPLQLPVVNSTPQNAPAASLAGKWVVEGSGSLAGFRVPESFLTQSGTIVGRTSSIGGSLTISQDEVSTASFQVDLSKLTVGGKPNTNLLQILDTAAHQYATFTLTSPIVLSNLGATGQTSSSTATGTLAFHGISRHVTFEVAGRYDGSGLEAAGSATIRASDWNVSSPFGIGDDDVIEFLVVMQHG